MNPFNKYQNTILVTLFLPLILFAKENTTLTAGLAGEYYFHSFPITNAPDVDAAMLEPSPLLLNQNIDLEQVKGLKGIKNARFALWLPDQLETVRGVIVHLSQWRQNRSLYWIAGC